MKRVLALTGFLTLIMPTATYAATTSVSVQNTVDSTSNSESTSTSQSHVRIETNGEVKEFNTNGNETVDWKSDDGKSSVKINNSGGATVKTESDNEDEEATSSSTSAPSTPTPTDAVSQAEDDSTDAKADFNIPLTPISMVVTLVRSIFSLI